MLSLRVGGPQRVEWCCPHEGAVQGVFHAGRARGPVAGSGCGIEVAAYKQVRGRLLHLQPCSPWRQVH